MRAARVAACLLALCSLRAQAASFSARAKGTTTAGFLELGAGARAEAMGGAYSAAAEGADALYWNPAGLGALRGGEATLMHAPYLAGSSYEYAAAAHQAGPGAFAAGAQYFSAGSVEQTDIAGASLGNTSPYDMALAAGYGAQVSDGSLAGLGAGISAKLIQSRLATTARTFAADLGLTSPKLLKSNRLRLALTARNLGGAMKFDSSNEALPLILAAAAAVRVEENWLLVAQTAFPRGGDPEFSAGAEYAWKAAADLKLAGRGGVSSRTLGEVSGLSGITVGMGFGFRAFSLDYALVPLGDLGPTHRMSMTLRWGGPAEDSMDSMVRKARAKLKKKSDIQRKY